MIKKIKYIIKTHLKSKIQLNEKPNCLIYFKIIQANMSQLQLLETHVASRLGARGFTPYLITQICNQIENIDPIMKVCILLIQFILEEIKSFHESGNYTYDKETEQLMINLDISEGFKKALNDWVEKEYPVSDRREIISDDVKVRRFDSLARILSSQLVSISVCGAVTIVTSDKKNPQLIVSGNLSGPDQYEAFLSEVRGKIMIIKKFYKTYKDLEPDSLDAINLSKDLFNLLFPSRKSPIKLTSAPPGEEKKPGFLEQAVFKLTHALFFCSETFTQEEKNAFLDESKTILLLPYIEETRLGMLICEMEPQLVNKSVYFSQVKGEPFELKNIHAEQLIVLYINDFLQIPKGEALIVGISKLCCITCNKFLAEFSNVITRGQHNQGYPGVIDLRTGSREKPPISPPGPTYAQSSPYKSPLKKGPHLEEEMKAPVLAGDRQRTSNPSKSYKKLFLVNNEIVDEPMPDEPMSGPSR